MLNCIYPTVRWLAPCPLFVNHKLFLYLLYFLPIFNFIIFQKLPLFIHQGMGTRPGHPSGNGNQAWSSGNGNQAWSSIREWEPDLFIHQGMGTRPSHPSGNGNQACLSIGEWEQDLFIHREMGTRPVYPSGNGSQACSSIRKWEPGSLRSWKR